VCRCCVCMCMLNTCARSLHYRSHNAAGTLGVWAARLPLSVELVAVAAGGTFVAAADSARVVCARARRRPHLLACVAQVRVYTVAGTARDVRAVAGDVVTLAACDTLLAVVCADVSVLVMA
jgi:hypothetical protein